MNGQIREYLEKAYNINAMELTTEEIVALVKKNKDLEEIRLVLKEMLEISDLVKFAKYVPLDNVNEASVLNAFMIVNLFNFSEFFFCVFFCAQSMHTVVNKPCHLIKFRNPHTSNFKCIIHTEYS